MTKIEARIEEIKSIRAARKVREIELMEQKTLKQIELNQIQKELNDNSFENLPEAQELIELLTAQKIISKYAEEGETI